MRLRQCEYFDAIVRCGTIRAASGELLVSEPTISTQIKELERELRVPLFIRRGRRLELSQEGRLLAPLLRRVVISAAAATVTAEELRLPRGTLRVGVVPSYAATLVPHLVSLCADRYSEVSLEVVESGSLALEQDLLDGQLDLAVLTRSAGVSSADSILTVQPLAPGRLVAVVGASHPLAGRRTLAPGDLLHEQLLLYRAGYLVRELVLSLLGKDALRHVLYSSDNNETTRAFIAQGFGVGFAVVPNLQPAKDTAPALVQLRITSAPAVELCCVYLTGRHFPRLISEILADSMRHHLESMPGT